MALCLAIALLDGFDALTMGYVVPSIAEDWGISAGLLTPVLTAGPLGMMFSTVTLGSVADRRGRRIVIISGVAAFGVFTGALSFAPNVETLSILRFLAGVGLGAVLPSLIALTAEYTPIRRKSMVTTAVAGAGIGAGGFIGGILSSFLIPAFGWQSFFAVGGLAPLLLVPLLVKFLPESLAFLAAQQRESQVRSILAKISPSYTNAELRMPAVERIEKRPLRHLFTTNRAMLTILLWTGYFCQYVMLFVLTGWMPTLLSDAGMGSSASIWATSLLTLGNMLGALYLGAVIDRRKQDFRFVALGFPVGALTILALVFSLPTTALVIPLAFVLGFSALATAPGLTALAVQLYPTPARATGLAWGLAAGRAGSLLGPLAVGILIQLNFESSTIFALGIVPAILAAIAVALLVRRASTEIRRQTGAGSRTVDGPPPAGERSESVLP
ncbi:MFS transporter (plasmid) [Rhodococcus sp. USK10]|uniref:MFS transporter n=1 Tax=Rhodococcus sp. USK10 TaxID=2789739 RepID=UPI001C5D8730|nr:MFS transporter [Rhodococcus sp. USK10]QYB00389.1 MFS transporter [Rhodococcus sp. USK10]